MEMRQTCASLSPRRSSSPECVRGAVSTGQLASEDVADASRRIGSVPIVLHQPRTYRRSWRWRSVLSGAVPTTRRMSCSPKNSIRSYRRSTGRSLETPPRVDCLCSSSRLADARHSPPSSDIRPPGCGAERFDLRSAGSVRPTQCEPRIRGRPARSDRVQSRSICRITAG